MWHIDFIQLFGGAGLAVGAPLQLARLRRARDRRTRQVEGKVVGSERRSGASGMDHHRPSTNHAVVEYQVNDRVLVCVSGYGVSWKETPPGERMTVLYNPCDPGDAEVVCELGRRIEVGLLKLMPIVGACLLVAFALRHL